MQNKLIANPGREFGPAPWWAWLGDMTPATIDRNLQRFLAMEIYEIIVIPLYGLQPEYMGPEYFELWRHACRRCGECGIKLWIYDEFNWPSGTCAGTVLRQHPRFRQHVLQINPAPAAPGRRARPAWEIALNEKFQLAAYGAEWACGAAGYLDTLNPDAVRAYLDATHEVYRREIGGYFGKVIVGFFTDEPVMVAGGAGLPYTPRLFALFRERYGYDLRPRIPALAAPAPDALRVRGDYWKLVAELFQKNYFRQYAAWCAAHGLQMTGHLLHEEMLSACLHRNGDMYAMLAEMQTPGIDLLRGVAGFDAGRIIAAEESRKRDITGKLIESIAYFSNKQRTLCEAFGCMPHSATLVDYKRAADFLFHHGISLINDNLFPDSTGSFRKFCGCHIFLTPWTRHYRIFSRYIRTMSRLNSGSRLATSIGLYYPGADARARYAPPQSLGLGPNFQDAAWDATQSALHDLAHGLLRRHWDYYLVFDQVLRAAKTVPGGLRMREFDCRALIFPDIHYVDTETAAVLRRFVRAGGLMLCVGRVPMVLDQSGRTQPGRWGAAARVIEICARDGEIAAEVARRLRTHCRPPVEIGGAGASGVMATRRETRAGAAMYLTNFGEAAADLAISLPGAWRKIDPVTAQPGGWLTGAERLLPGESLLCLRARKPRPRAAAPAFRRPAARLDDTWHLTLPEGNVVSLPMAVYTGKSTPRPPAARAADWAPPGVETAPLEFVPDQSCWLRREIDVACKPRRLELIVDGCDGCEIFVNRRRVCLEQARLPVWDDGNLCGDLRKYVRRGRNEILIRYTPARIRRFVARVAPLNDLPPFVLRGDFLAASRLDRPEVAPVLAPLPGRVQTGPLQPRGYPNFAGVAEYSQTIRLAKTGGRVILDLGRQNDLFEVEINGRLAGVLCWPPYRLEVGKFLRRGDNLFIFRMRTALGGVLSRFYAGFEKTRPPVGMLETPVLYASE